MRGDDGVSRFDIIIGMKSCIFPIAVLAAVLAQGAQEYRVPFGEAFEVKERELVDITFRARVAKGASVEAMPDWQSDRKSVV